MTPKPLLRLENVTISFDGFRALDNLNFTVLPRTVKVLIGPNGAGKSTILDAITGKVRPSAGRVFYKGQNITRRSEHGIARMGIRRKFQAPGVLDNLSIRDNLALSALHSKNLWATLRAKLNPVEQSRVDETLEVIGLAKKQQMRAGQLAHGEKQWLEIGITVVSDPELMLLDEPTAGMTRQETSSTAQLILALSQRRTILVIEHDMNFVEQLNSPVSVLHMGRLLKEGDIGTIRNDPEVISIYLGRSRTEESHDAAS